MRREWDVEYTDGFGRWWDGLTPDERVTVASVVGLRERACSASCVRAVG
jgi:hypothetical protein